MDELLVPRTGFAWATVLALSVAAAVAAWAWRPSRSRPTLLAAVVVLAGGVAALLAAFAPPQPPVLVALVGAAAVLAAVTGGGPLALAVLRLADRADGSSERGTSASHPIADAASVLRGGRWIGALERGGVAAALLTGWGAGVPVVLGVKGLGRYPELRHPGAAERFIIGTLVSVLWAAAMAGIGFLVR